MGTYQRIVFWNSSIVSPSVSPLSSVASFIDRTDRFGAEFQPFSPLKRDAAQSRISANLLQSHNHSLFISVLADWPAIRCCWFLLWFSCIIVLFLSLSLSLSVCL